jgi:hypothetical protein
MGLECSDIVVAGARETDVRKGGIFGLNIFDKCITQRLARVDLVPILAAVSSMTSLRFCSLITKPYFAHGQTKWTSREWKSLFTGMYSFEAVLFFPARESDLPSA